MRKAIRMVVFTFLFLFSFASEAQYGNEWIVPGQLYYKISVAQDGIFKLTFNDLQTAGFPVVAVDPAEIQLFHRGQEHAIIVQGQGDGSLDPGDFIEFYGRKNDGTLDADLYKPASSQPHQFINLYSDTSAYFLTWNVAGTQGRRMEDFSSSNISGIPEAFHVNEVLKVNNEEYSVGYTVERVYQNTFFDQGEGWTGRTICIISGGCVGQRDYDLDAPGGVTSQPPPQLEVFIVGRDELNHNAEVYAGPNTSSLRLLGSSLFQNFETKVFTTTLNWTDIAADGKITVRVKALGVGGIRDRLSVSYIRIKYPGNFDLQNQPVKYLWLQPNAADSTYVELNNPAPGTRVFDVSYPSDPVTIGTAAAGASLAVVVSGTSAGKKLLVTSQEITPTIKPVSFRLIDPASHNYIIISNRSLMKPALTYSDPVKAYAGYRASPEGGGYDTLVVTIDQLYQQFNYGETSSRAIYQFMKFMTDGGDPKYLFLIGKGLDVSFFYNRNTVFGPADFTDLVPSAGIPGADMNFTAGLNGTTFEPGVPTGRITASTPWHVAIYLNKIKETEATPFEFLWRKNLLHLSGGINPGEPQQFKSYVDSYAATAAGPYFGARTETRSKQTLNVEQIDISDQVNAGLGLVTFYGHSSPSTIDFDIGFVSDPVLNYNNSGKYPVFLLNGCNAGRFYANNTIFGEDWILAASKGAKGFIAHSSFGSQSSLNLYSDLFYQVGFADSAFIKKGVGDVQKEVAIRFLLVSSPNIISHTQVQQMAYLGDPAVKLFGAVKPDYETNVASVSAFSFDARPITALTDSFALKIKVRNFGQARPDSLTVRVTRILNDNSQEVYDSLFGRVYYEEDLLFVIRKSASNGFGNNQFKVEVDYGNVLPELKEDNNEATLNFFIPLSATLNLFPLAFSIVNQSQVNLIFQNTNPLSDSRTYRLEIDTTDLFNSPFLTTKMVTAKVLAKTTVDLLALDSIAYYWRTKLDQPLPDESQEWFTSSFSMISNSPEGWTQLHFPQFTENESAGLTLDTISRTLRFKETVADVSVHNYGSASGVPYTSTSLKINEEEYNLSTQGQPCRNHSFNLVAFEKSSAAPYPAIPFNFQDPRTCGREPQLINSFLYGELQTGNNDDIIKWVDNVGLSDSVVLFTIGDPGVAFFPAPVMSKLGELGIDASQLTGVAPGEPIIIFGKKGAAPGSALVNRPSLLPANQQELISEGTITGRFTSGSLKSVLIGPAQSWEDLKASVKGIEASDIFSFDVDGVTLQGVETPLLSGLDGTLVSLSTVDANQHPLLRLTLLTEDAVNLTPVQLKNWTVHYTPVPEGLLLFNGEKETQSLFEGQSWTGDYTFHNISTKSFPDSLQAEFFVFNKDSEFIETSVKKIKAPLPGDSTSFSFSTDTQGKSGLNNVNAFVNRRIIPEQYYENNVIDLIDYLEVTGDEAGPVIDVTIDGRHVVNGDFVASAPEILIRIIDENTFLLKQDTSGIIIVLVHEVEDLEERIYFSRSDVTWNEASATEPFTILFIPSLSAGSYTLKVTASDASGNSGGSEPYEVSFAVDDQSTFMFSPPYPNPSNEVFIFPFRITGDLLPDEMSLRILSPDGRLVRHITENQVGGFHVGMNRLTWNTSNELEGQMLPGLYYYRFELTIGGKSHNQSGRLVLMK